MNTPSDNPAVNPRLRDHLPLAPQREMEFRWRGTEVSRMEGFTDAVFGFAVTLLIVALEVPRSFEGLLDVVRGFPAFILCFTLLMLLWNAHYRFHRRYGMDDALSRVLTMGILVLVLFFVYPLKFLFTLITAKMFGLDMEHVPHVDGPDQVRWLYVIYGAGFAGAWGFYSALYAHAWRKRHELQLDGAEALYTRAALAENLIYVGVCLLSIVLALFTTSVSLPGFVYFLLGPLQMANGWWYGSKIRAIHRIRVNANAEAS